MRRRIGDALLRPDQHRRQVSGELTGQGDLQRVAVAGIHHRRSQRRQVADPIDQTLELRPGNHGRSVAKRDGTVNTTPIIGAYG